MVCPKNIAYKYKLCIHINGTSQAAYPKLPKIAPNRQNVSKSGWFSMTLPKKYCSDLTVTVQWIVLPSKFWRCPALKKNESGCQKIAKKHQKTPKYT